MADIEDIITGVTLMMDASSELASLWELTEGGGGARLVHVNPNVLKGRKITARKDQYAEELVALVAQFGKSDISRKYEQVEVEFGDIYIARVNFILASNYMMVGFGVMPFPFELKHHSRSDKVSNIERKITRNIVHELLTPINSMQGLNEQLKETILDEDTRTVLDIYSDSCALLKSNLTESINFVSLKSAELKAFTIETYDVFETLFSVSSKANRSILENQRKLLFRLNYPTDLDSLVCEGYADLLEQTLLFLIDNAIRFTPDGGRVTVDFTVSDDWNWLAFSVTDTGIGIPEDNRGLLFRPFVLGDMEDTRMYRGMGLGLPSALESVKIMSQSESARIELESEEGKGSSFSFQLPLYRGKSVLPEKPKELELPKEPCEYCVLIAEDNPTQQMIIKRLIDKLGFRSTIVSNGLEAVGEYVRGDTAYNLILMDIQMPGISGHDATQMIRAHEEKFQLQRIPIVAVSANIEKDVHSESLRVGMDGHYGKPVTRISLSTLIRKALLGISL